MKRTLFYDLPAKAKRPTLKQYERWLKRNKRLTPAVAEATVKAKHCKKLEKTIVYIAGVLTEASEADKARYERMSALIESFNMFGYVPHLHGTDPVSNPPITPNEVRDIDYLWAVVMADFHIHFMSPIGHGNAIEASWAETFGIPMIHCVTHGTPLGRLTKGLLTIDQIVVYHTLDALYEQLRGFLVILRIWHGNYKSKNTIEFFLERKYTYNSYGNWIDGSFLLTVVD